MNECDAHNANMIAYRALYNSLKGEFDGCELQHIGRESNEEADRLANIGSTCARVPPGLFLEQIFLPSIKRKFHKGPEKLDTEAELVSLMQVMAIKETWTQPYLSWYCRRVRH